MPKRLRPTLRENKRYIAYELVCEEPVREDLSFKILSKITSLLGMFYAGEAGIQSIAYAPLRQRGILRVSTKHTDLIKSELLLLQSRDIALRTPSLIRILCVSGNVAQTKRYLQNNKDG